MKEDLTGKEKEVYKLLLKGYLQKEIANILKVKYTTVRTHTDRIFKKKLVNTQSELLAQRIEELEDELSRHYER